MRELLPESLFPLAEKLKAPLYVVGGFVRDFLAGLSREKPDFDICSPASADDFLAAAESCGFIPAAVYRHTGTVKLKDGQGHDFEYTCFRSDKYVRGTHVPVETFFTDDIRLDARRRDFTVNAVYYDVRAGEFTDPLGGMEDIGAKRLKTVDRAEKVFGEDGLRLMRLCRFAGQLGFVPDEECLAGAKANAALIADISPERIFAELAAILHADGQYGVPYGHYAGLKLLEETGVLAQILPELALGKDMGQRKDFHKYDVLEHSLRAAKYADQKVRLSALLHDVGKPFCMLRDGNTYAHPEEGGRIAGEILARFRAPKRTAERVCELVRLHMYDFDGRTKPGKLRRFFVRNAPLLDDLLLLKQADYSGCMDDLSPCPTALRWRAELEKMKEEGAPLSLKELHIRGDELLNAGVPPALVSETLRELLCRAAVCPQSNQRQRLLALLPDCLKTARARTEKKRAGKNGETDI